MKRLLGLCLVFGLAGVAGAQVTATAVLSGVNHGQWASTTPSGALEIRDVHSGELAFRRTVPLAHLCALTWLDEARLWCGAEDGAQGVLDVATGAWTAGAGTREAWLASGDLDGQLWTWQSRRGLWKAGQPWTMGPALQDARAIVPDQDAVLVAPLAGGLVAREAGTGRELWRGLRGEAVTALVRSGQQWAAATSSGRVYLGRMADGRVEQSWPLSHGPARALAASGDGLWLALGADFFVTVWDAQLAQNTGGLQL